MENEAKKPADEKKTDEMPTYGVRPRDWMHQLGVGKHGLAILIREHGHPAPIALGARSKMFIRAELDAWLEARKKTRDAA